MQNPRILIIRLTAIGDVLHCTPVAKNLKSMYPNCHISWLVAKVPAEILKGNYFIDEVIVWSREDFEKYLRQGQISKAWDMLRKLVLDLQKKNFDILLDIHGLFITGLIAKLSKVPRRIGMKGTKELNWAFMTEYAPLVPKEAHVIERYLSVLYPLGFDSTFDLSMDFYISKDDDNYVSALLKEYDVESNKLIAINPVTTWKSKDWPPEFYAEVIKVLAAQAKIILCGGPNDKDIADKIEELSSGITIINAVGKTSLRQLGALFNRCDLLIAGDTGPLHMAVALDVPTVSIFGPTEGSRIGPLTKNHIILQASSECRSCYKYTCRHQDLRCLRSITPSMVISAAQKILNKN